MFIVISFILVIGANDEIDDDFSDEDFDDEIDKLNDRNFQVPAMEVNRAPASLYPSLDPIAEASSESFQSMPTSSRDTSSIIEIEPKKTSLQWRDVNHQTNPSNENCKNYEDNSWDRILDKDELYQFEKSKAAENSEDNDKENENDNVINGDRSYKRREEKSSIKYAEYIFDDQFDDDNVKTTDSSHTSRKHRHKHKLLNGHSKSNKDKTSERTKEIRNGNRNYSENINNERDFKKRSKSRESSRKLISVDILGMYEDNADLQRVSRSELTTPKQDKKDKSKSKRSPKRSPKRSRSTSPRKKSGRGKQRHDLTPLPPGLKLYSDGRSRSVNSANKLRSECSSRDSSRLSFSFDDGKDGYKTLESMKDDRRYRKPDSVLWERLEISEADVTNKREKVKWADRCDNKYRYAGLIEEDGIDNSTREGRRMTWNVPIYEQIKNIKGSKNVPDVSKFSKVNIY